MPAPSKTALFAAATAWDASAVNDILKAAPELVTKTDPRGRMALHLACAVPPGKAGLGEPNGVKTVAALLAAGAPLEAAVPMDEDEGDFRATPLWYAASRGVNLPLVIFLIEHGADASYSLWTVVFRDDAEMCRALLTAKPRLNLVAHGETPIFYAARLKRLKTLRLLIDAGANPAIKDTRGRNAVDIAKARRLPQEFVARLEQTMARQHSSA
jgi:uncharacterized protein